MFFAVEDIGMRKTDLLSRVGKMGTWGLNCRKVLSSGRDTGSAVGIWRREGWHQARSGRNVFGKVFTYSLEDSALGLLSTFSSYEKNLPIDSLFTGFTNFNQISYL